MLLICNISNKVYVVHHFVNSEEDYCCTCTQLSLGTLRRTSVSLHLNMPITKTSLCCSPKLAEFSKFGRCFPLNGRSSRHVGLKFITACVSIDHVREN